MQDTTILFDQREPPSQTVKYKSVRKSIIFHISFDELTLPTIIKKYSYKKRWVNSMLFS